MNTLKNKQIVVLGLGQNKLNKIKTTKKVIYIHPYSNVTNLNGIIILFYIFLEKISHLYFTI